MKENIFLIALVIVGTLFNSCSDEGYDNGKNDGSNQETAFIGKWLETSVRGELIKNNDTQVTLYEPVIDENNFKRITFKNDGTFFVFRSNDYSGEVETDTFPGTYTVEDNIISFFYGTDLSLPTLNTFSFLDNKLILTKKGENTKNGDEYVYTEVRTLIRL
jgi:hypothetical protein